jgi:hydrophobe/amphiphile efflux-1 (HAE1) family protein
MSSLSSVSIQRPVLSIVMSVVIVLFGLIGMQYLGVREYPSVEPPIITVSCGYTGANADIIESQITEPIEGAVNGIAGIRSITSTSSNGRSSITIEFTLGADLEAAANDVRDKVSQVVRLLPVDADPPVVSKADADGSPIVFITIFSEQRSLLELSEIAENIFKERLQTIPGVSAIQIWGQKKYSMRLWMDPDKMAAYQLTPLDVRAALLRENIELPSGMVEGANTELTVRTQGRMSSPDDFNKLIIKEEGGSLVRFRDLGYAELAPENMRTVLRRDGKPMVGNAIQPQPGTNHIEIADEVYKRLEQIKKDIPQDLQVSIGFDTTQYIRSSIKEVEQTIYLAFGLVVLIIFLFLRDWRTTIIPVLAIPISLIGSFFVMYLAGFSINVLTLLGIVLAIGLVVDDAIVVLENIYAKIEAGKAPLQAALTGSREIFFAVISTTVTLVAVFLPVIFLQGLTGRLFREFGAVISGSVLISSFVALTLTAMLSSRILKKRAVEPWFYRVTEPFFLWLNRTYRSALAAFFRVRWMAFVIMGLAVGMIFFFGNLVPSELAPNEDRSRLRAVVTAPEGSTFEFTDSVVMDLYRLVNREVGDEKDGITSVTAPGFGATSAANNGFVNIILKDADKRTRSQQQIMNDLTPMIRDQTRARIFLTQEPTISVGGRRGGLPVQFVIQAPNFEKLKSVMPDFLAVARQNPTFTVVDVDLKFNKPEIDVRIDRQKAQDLGVSMFDVAQTLQLAFSGSRFGYFILNGKQYQVIGQVQREDRNKPADLRRLYVRNNRGQMIQLDNLISITESSAPPALYRYNRFIAATVSAGLAPGKTIGDGIEAMEAVAEQVLDDTFLTALSGQSKDFKESSSSLLFAFGLALILIFLVLSAQFESFRDPFIILFTVPLAMAGALLALWFFDATLNIFSQIGIIMLVGLVAKNGILIVEFANQRKEQGLSKIEAIQDAAVARFRPILMTSFSTILGTLPIALALGSGAESRVSMGVVVVAGMAFSSLLTLFVIPAVYSYFSSEKANILVIVEEEEAVGVEN